MIDISILGRQAYLAAQDLALLPAQIKNKVLLHAAIGLRDHLKSVIAVNTEEVAAAKEAGLQPAMLDRMTLTLGRYAEMIQGLEQVVMLPDPIGEEEEGRILDNGLKLIKCRVPLGVIGVIYESRPNVTIDTAALCLKSGNACILRGGRECIKTNAMLFSILQDALRACKVNPDAVSFIDDPDHALVDELLHLHQYVDVIIPRGGAALQRRCREQSSVPVITGGFGISHAYVDKSADLKKAVPVIVNAKVQKPSACNALDTLLLQQDIAKPCLDLLLPQLQKHKVELHADPEALQLLGNYPYAAALGRDDFDTEWLSLKLNLRVIPDFETAILHLREHHASHSDMILTENLQQARRFGRSIGSACAYVNASTRFTDGGQFGLGAEVAISTQKLHARGPMGLKELTTYQYECSGDYLVRS